MSNSLHIKNRAALRIWLNNKPAAWSRVIALRAAMRILPILTRMLDSPEGNIEQRKSERIVLSALRLVLLIHAHNSKISPILIAEITAENSIERAKDAVTAFEHAVATAIARNDITAAANAAATVDAAARAATPAFVDGDLWQSVQNDINWLENTHLEKIEDQEAGLFSKLLWQNNYPPKIRDAWHKFARSSLAKDSFFSIWVDWYEAIALLDASSSPSDIFGEEITKRIVTQTNGWWNRPAKEVNADIANWLREGTASDDRPDPQHDIVEALEALPTWQPAPYLFDWRDGRMEVLPPDTLPDDGGIAQDYLDETREKADDLLEALARSNTDPTIARKVGRLRQVLTERAADLRPALVDSRSISVERLAKALDNPQDAAEMPARILADLGDLADTARRLCNCLPALWQRDVERLANSLTPESASALLRHLNALRDGIKDADIIGPDVQAAFDTLSEDSAEPDADDVRRRRIAMFGLTARNLLTTLLRASKGAADKLVDYARSAGKEFYPELVKAPAKLTVGTAVNFAAACLVIALLGATSGIAQFFPEINRVVRILEALKAGEGKPPTPPPSTEPPLSPRTLRPTVERGPTRPA